MKTPDPLAAIAGAVEVEAADLEIPEKQLTRFMRGLAPDIVERCVRQKLSSFAMTESVLPSLTLRLGGVMRPVSVTLPRSWRVQLQRRGIDLDHPASRVRWILKLARLWAGGFYGTLSLIRWTWSSPKSAPSTADMVIFLPTPAMAAGEPGPRNFDFLSTFLGSRVREDRDRTVRVVSPAPPRAAVPGVSFAPIGLPTLRGSNAKLKFTGTAFAWAAMNLIRIATGEWWRAALQAEGAYYLYMTYVREADIAASYVYTSANLQVRPLWTYRAQDAGARVILAFISTNFFTLTPVRGGRAPINTGFRDLSWPIYAVWGPGQRRLMETAGHSHARFIDMGPVGYVEDTQTDVSMPPNSIVVFDVAPLRHALLADMGYPSPYFDIAARRMISDVVTLARRAGFTVVVKQKPKSDRNTDGRYRTFLGNLAAAGDITVIPTNVSPHRLIEQARGVISAPFTSTAFVARALGKPTAFYDSLDVLQGARDNADGVPLLCGSDELSKWLSSLSTLTSPAGRACVR